MRVLITGIGGFVGRHLARHLLEDGVAQLHGTVLDVPATGVPEAVALHAVDLRDADATRAVLAAIQPQQVYHVAAQASVGRSFAAAWDTLENNIRAQLNVIHGCLDLPTPPRLLVVSSGEIYGAADPARLPADENTPFCPTSPYSVSKITQDMLALQYFRSHGLPVIRARPFNHLGPGQSEGFVAPDFAMQIARIEAGDREPKIYVGNLSAERDFTDVRDVVRAYRLLMERGTPGEVYNVASGTTHSIQQLLDILLSFATAKIEICQDRARARPASAPILWGDAARLRRATGWEPVIPFEQTLRDVLDDCRERVGRLH